MWMKPGSFWTQALGEAHITSAKGEENIALVEIDQGPYLVKPTSQAFDNSERSVNIDATNIVWLNNKQTNWINFNSKAEISFLWKHPEIKNLQGLFIKLSKDFKGKIFTNGKTLQAVVISGNIQYKMPITDEIKTLDAGSYFTSKGKAFHAVSNSTEVIIYIRTDGKVEVEE